MLTNERTKKTLQALRPTRILLLHLTDRRHLPGGLSNDNGARCTDAEFAGQHILPGVRFPSDRLRYIDRVRISESSLSER